MTGRAAVTLSNENGPSRFPACPGPRPTPSGPQRAALALEIDGAKEAVFTAVNTSYRGIYLFGGADNATAQ